MNPSPADMTMRDWFAGQALTALVSRSDDATAMLTAVSKAYQFADLMLTERDRGRR